jgi:hypothetical protein
MKLSVRTIVVTLTVCCLAILAGVVAEQALANGSTEYCDHCTLPSSGVPAQSTVFKDFYYNLEASSYSVYANMQIYNYYSGTTTCAYRQDDTILLYTGSPQGYGQNQDSCIPSTIFSSARCHLLDGTGPITAICYANYQTA